MYRECCGVASPQSPCPAHDRWTTPDTTSRVLQVDNEQFLRMVEQHREAKKQAAALDVQCKKCVRCASAPDVELNTLVQDLLQRTYSFYFLTQARSSARPHGGGRQARAHHQRRGGQGRRGAAPAGRRAQGRGTRRRERGADQHRAEVSEGRVENSWVCLIIRTGSGAD